MTHEEIQNIIDRFDENDLKNHALFGIFTYGGGSDESFIRANKEGLELFALQLLKASNEIEPTLVSKENKYIHLDFQVDWIDQDSHTFLQYIDPRPDKLKIKEIGSNSKLGDILFPYGCGLIFITLGVSVIVGLITMLTWLCS